MALTNLPQTREDFKEYCLRKLGKGAIQINVTEDQTDDRINEALEHFYEYHDEGTERVFLSHETTQDDMDNEYFTMPDDIIGIEGYMKDLGQMGSVDFDVEYHFMQDNMHDINSGEFRYFWTSMMQISMIEQFFDYYTPIEYRRTSNRVYIHTDWKRKFSVGQHVVFDATRMIDADEFGRVWQNKWLRDYATSLIKMQWGQNLSKYEGIVLMNGVQFDGKRLIDEAQQELENLEQQVKETETHPLPIIVG